MSGDSEQTSAQRNAFDNPLARRGTVDVETKTCAPASSGVGDGGDVAFESEEGTTKGNTAASAAAGSRKDLVSASATIKMQLAV